MNDTPPEEQRQPTSVRVHIFGGREQIYLSNLKTGPVAFYVEGHEELLGVIQALTEAAGLYVHHPDGCTDLGCPCIQAYESQKQAR